MHVISQGDADIYALAEALNTGATIVYPTETCYGLGCDATNPAAVARVYAAKERPKDKPLIILASSLDMMRPYVEIMPALEAFAKKYWPGPVTIVMSRRGGDLAPGVAAADGTIAFRVTGHPFARKLVEVLGKPLISTSANVSGGENPYTIEDAVSADIVVDAGTLPVCAPSTVVRLSEGTMNVLRQGSVEVA